MKYDEFVEQARELLPQFALIKPDNMKRWHEVAMVNDPDRLMWHLERLRTVGGSESGVIVADSLGLPPPFGNRPVDIYNAKLMISQITKSNDAMSFGTKHEDMVRDTFHEAATRKGWTRADKVLALMELRKRDPAVVGGLGYSPDDAFIDPTGKLHIVDYKTPYRSEPSADVPVGYVSQLHQGRRVAIDELGIDKDDPMVANGVGMLLVYGIHPKSYVPSRTSKLRLKPYTIHTNDEIDRVIREEVATFFDRHILSLTPPGEIMSDQSTQIVEQIDELVRLRADAARIEAEITSITAQLNARITESGNLAKQKAVADAVKRAGAAIMPVISVGLSKKLTAEQVKAATKDMEGEFVTTQKSKEPDPALMMERMTALAVQAGVDAPAVGEFLTNETVINKDALIEHMDSLPKDFFALSISWRENKTANAERNSVESPSPQ